MQLIDHIVGIFLIQFPLQIQYYGVNRYRLVAWLARLAGGRSGPYEAEIRTVIR